MVTVSAENHRNVNESFTVRIAIPDVDRAKTDAHPILGAVFSKIEKSINMVIQNLF